MEPENVEVQTSEQASWLKHRNAMLAVSPSAAGFRGCIGLGMLVAAETSEEWIEINDKMFLPDKAIRWASIVDIPKGFWRFDPRTTQREVHWATIRPTSFYGGMPLLKYGSEEHNAWDFRRLPMTDRQNGPDVFSPDDEPQLFRVFNSIEWAMTSVAFQFNFGWKDQKDKFYKLVGEEYSEDKKVFMFGNDTFDFADRPVGWAPRAYLSFPSEVGQHLYLRSTRCGLHGEIMYPDSLKYAFVTAFGLGCPYQAKWPGKVVDVYRDLYLGIPVLVFVLKGEKEGQVDIIRFTRYCKVRKGRNSPFRKGDIIAEESYLVPDDWGGRSLYKLWEYWLPKLVGCDNVDTHMRIWFERQYYNLQSGRIHVSAELANCAALSSSEDSSLMWDVGPSMPYYDEVAEAFIFPTIQIRRWHEMNGVLPGELAYDLTPYDSRFMTYDEAKSWHAWLRGDRKEESTPAQELDTCVEKVVLEKPTPAQGPDTCVTLPAATFSVKFVSKIKNTMTLTVNGTSMDCLVTGTTKFFGPRGGAILFKDARIKRGAKAVVSVKEGLLVEFKLNK